MSSLDARELSFRELVTDHYDNATYSIPVYQRIYAWTHLEVDQLVSDVVDAMNSGAHSYFLGNLVVHHRTEPSPQWEVIDGQQRLTTLFIFEACCRRLIGDENALPAHQWLTFRSRPESAEELRRLSSASSLAETHVDSNVKASRITAASRVIADRLAAFAPEKTQKLYEYLLHNVRLVRVDLPSGTNLNRYFEVMNTRGQQLLAVDIVKARLMSRLPESDHSAFDRLWAACATMDEYVQQPLTRGDTALRTAVFGEDWTTLRPQTWSELVAALSDDANSRTGGASRTSRSRTLREALEFSAATEVSDEQVNDQTRYESIISFEMFLLHALAVLRPQGEHSTVSVQDNDPSLEDSALIKRFFAEFPKLADAEASDRDLESEIGEFALGLLRLRVLFDENVIKREFTVGEGEDGNWSLDTLSRGFDRKGGTSRYRRTFETSHDSIVRIQSMLRITYTAPRSMRWITYLLSYLDAREGKPPIRGPELLTALESFARTRVRGHLSDVPSGFSVPHIMFTYLDYLLVSAALDEDYSSPDEARLGDPQKWKDYTFRFRTSIEHFCPQNPGEHQGGILVDPKRRDDFGNLALIGVSDNSRFGNLSPSSKTNYDYLIKQSPKLSLMARQASNWDNDAVARHGDAMLAILRRDIAKEQA